MHNEGTRLPEPPEWMKLDAVCPPELREEMADLVRQVEEIIPKVDMLARLSYLAIRTYDRVTPDEVDFGGYVCSGGTTVGTVDVPYELFSFLTGYDRLHGAMYRLAGIAMAGADDPSVYVPDWYLDRQGMPLAKLAALRSQYGAPMFGLTVEGERDEAGEVTDLRIAGDEPEPPSAA